MNENTYIEKLKAKYQQVQGKIKEMKSDAALKIKLQKKQEKIESYLEDLANATAEKVSAASQKAQDAIDDFESEIQTRLKN